MSTIADTLHLTQTKFFIDQDFSKVVFTRKRKIPDGAGGMKENPPEETYPQKVRVVGARNGAVTVTPDGRHVPIHKFIVGLPGIDVQIADTFEHNGQMFEVIGIQNDPPWRVVAESSRHGS